MCVQPGGQLGRAAVNSAGCYVSNSWWPPFLVYVLKINLQAYTTCALAECQPSSSPSVARHTGSHHIDPNCYMGGTYETMK